MSSLRRWGLTLELIGVFVVVPVAIAAQLVDLPKIPTLLALTVGCVVLLHRDPNWDLEEIGWQRVEARALRDVLLRFLLLAPAILMAALLVLPREEVFALPREQPGVFFALLVFYPLLSVLPQELIWRSFLFHRYRALFGGRVAVALASAMLFALLHAVYQNAMAPLLSVAGGLLFAHTFARTRSLWVVSLEHALYGVAIFAVGLGRFFYDQPGNVLQ
jgi:membrane protease YdiL (CAAX protease family)